MFVKHSERASHVLWGLISIALFLSCFCISCGQTPTRTPSPVRTATLEVFNPPHYGQVTVSEAIVRESADVTSVEIARLPSGATVSVVAGQGDWVRIEKPGIIHDSGWMLADFLVIRQSLPAPTAMVTATATPTLLPPPTPSPLPLPTERPTQSPTDTPLLIEAPTPSPTDTPLPHPPTPMSP